MSQSAEAIHAGQQDAERAADHLRFARAAGEAQAAEHGSSTYAVDYHEGLKFALAKGKQSISYKTYWSQGTKQGYYDGKHLLAGTSRLERWLRVRRTSAGEARVKAAMEGALVAFQRLSAPGGSAA